MHGIEHILFGFDHLLFVLALILIVRSGRVLLWTITAFTIAHSITLSLATLGVVHVPGPPVEATIALSILLLACEIVRLQRGQASLTAQWPWIVAFSFGLLHGFGFAGALTEIGLPQGDIPLALFVFNVGVEVGQLIFIAAVLGRWPASSESDLPPPSNAAPVGCDLCDRNNGRILVHRAPGGICDLRPDQGSRPLERAAARSGIHSICHLGVFARSRDR